MSKEVSDASSHRAPDATSLDKTGQLTPPIPSLVLHWEEYPWRPNQPQYMSRRQLRESAGPYRAAIPARIATMDVDLPSWVETDSAEDALAITRFDVEVSHALTGESSAEIAPLAAVLLRTESASSSQIENV